MPELERVIDARIDAYRPEGQPAFGELRTRRSRRQRLRAGGAVVASFAAVLGVVIAPSLRPTPARLADPSASRTAVAPPPGADSVRYSVSYLTAASYEQHSDLVDRCLQRRPGFVTQSSGGMPPEITVTASGAEVRRELVACLAPVLDVHLLDRNAGSGVRVVQWSLMTPAESVAWTGARICQVGPAGGCRRIGADAARALHDEIFPTILTVMPVGCTGGPPLQPGEVSKRSLKYTVAFEHASIPAPEMTVPYTNCDHIRLESATFLNPAGNGSAVEAAYTGADVQLIETRYHLGFRPETFEHGDTTAVEACVRRPGVSGGSAWLESNPPQMELTVVGLQELRADFERCITNVPNAVVTQVAPSRPYDAAVPARTTWTGAMICSVDEGGRSCRDVGAADTAALQDEIFPAELLPPGHSATHSPCAAPNSAYEITFEHATHSTPVVRVAAYDCLPTMIDGRAFVNRSAEAVRAAYETAPE